MSPLRSNAPQLRSNDISFYRLLRIVFVLQILFLFSFVSFVLCIYRHIMLKQRERYRLRVRAADKGVPASYADVDVDLDVVDRNNKPPIWDSIVYGPIHIKENVAINSAVATVKARLVTDRQSRSKCIATRMFALLTICYCY